MPGQLTEEQEREVQNAMRRIEEAADHVLTDVNIPGPALCEALRRLAAGCAECFEPAPDPYPECAKMHTVKERSRAIGDFILWLREEKGILLAEYHTHDESCAGGNDCGIYSEQPVPWRYNIERMLAEFFSIDLDKVEVEKTAMLEELRGNAGND